MSLQYCSRLTGNVIVHFHSILILSVALMLAVPGRGEAKPRQRVRSRLIRVVVKDSHGNPLKAAEITVIDAATKKPLEGAKFKVKEDGTTQIIVREQPKVELRANAPGKEAEVQPVSWPREYMFELYNPGEKVVLPALSPLATFVTSSGVRPRVLSVVVQDSKGNMLKDVVVAVINATSQEVIQQKLLNNGVGSFEAKVARGTKLKINAKFPGLISETKNVGSESSYVFRLKSHARSVNVMVEGKEGVRLKGAEVRVIDAKTKKAIKSWSVLESGFGPIEFDSVPGTNVVLEARAPGRRSVTVAVPKNSKQLMIQLERRDTQARFAVLVKNRGNQPVEDAVFSLVDENGKELATGHTNRLGKAEAKFKYKELFEARLEVRHGAYRNRAVPIRMKPDQEVEVILTPEAPKNKSSLMIILVLSRGFQKPPVSYVEVKKGIRNILEASKKNTRLWDYIGFYALGNREIRDILPFTRNADDHHIDQAKDRLRDLSLYSGAMTWRDLSRLNKFLEKSGRNFDAGCEILLIAPKNMAMQDDESLYDAGGEDIMSLFRARNLRLRWIEVGRSKTEAYKELCDGTFGHYSALVPEKGLSDKILKLQYHLPKPPQ